MFFYCFLGGGRREANYISRGQAQSSFYKKKIFDKRFFLGEGVGEGVDKYFRVNQ